MNVKILNLEKRDLKMEERDTDNKREWKESLVCETV